MVFLVFWKRKIDQQWARLHIKVWMNIALQTSGSKGEKKKKSQGIIKV